MPFKRLILTTMLLLTTFATTHAADPLLTLHGKVYEKGSRRPLDGVTIFVPGNDALMATTEQDGSFTLVVAAPGEYALAAAAVGYVKPAPLRATVEKDTGSASVTIYLEPVYTMNEVVVQAERNLDRIAKTVITGKELAS